MKDTISVIVPVYNVADYLPQCLDSLIGQTHTDLEIIVIDDGSTDGSGGICDAYAAKDSRIHVIHQKNGGAASAKNAGLRIATGTYLAFADSDDWVEPDAYEYMLDALKRENADVIQCAFRNVFTDHSEDHICFDTEEQFKVQEYLLRYTTDWTGSLLWDKLYRRALFDSIFFEEGHKIDDEFFTYLGIMNAKKIVYIPKIVYNYRQRRSSVTGNSQYCRQFVFDRLDYLTQRRERIVEKFPELRRAFDLYYLDTILVQSKDPYATEESLVYGRALLKRYLQEKDRTFPPYHLACGVIKLFCTPIQRLLRQRNTRSSVDSEQYFP